MTEQKKQNLSDQFQADEKKSVDSNKFDQMVHTIARWIIKTTKVHLDDNKVLALVQFIKFGIIGASNTIIAYGINILILKILEPYQLSWDYVLANVIAFLLSVLWAFFWNNRYVFISKDGETRSVWKTLLRTYMAYGFTGIFLTNVLSFIWIDIFGISKLAAPLINLLISVPLNFLINKYWAFK